MAFTPKQYTLNIEGTTYVAQFNGLAAALEAGDSCVVENTTRHSAKKLADYILTNVIVEPSGLQINDFEDIDILNQVIKFGSSVMSGKFRPNEE